MKKQLIHMEEKKLKEQVLCIEQVGVDTYTLFMGYIIV
jgi:hypothetical protein